MTMKSLTRRPIWEDGTITFITNGGKRLAVSQLADELSS